MHLRERDVSQNEGKTQKIVTLSTPQIQESQINPDPDTSENYCDTPPTSFVMFLQKHALRLAETA